VAARRMLSPVPADRLEAELQPAVNLSEDFLEISISREKPEPHGSIHKSGIGGAVLKLPASYTTTRGGRPKILGELAASLKVSVPATLQERFSVAF
jgi:hypothetical protein